MKYLRQIPVILLYGLSFPCLQLLYIVRFAVSEYALYKFVKA